MVVVGPPPPPPASSKTAAAAVAGDDDDGCSSGIEHIPVVLANVDILDCGCAYLDIQAGCKSEYILSIMSSTET